MARIEGSIPFDAGWSYGARHGEATMREIETMHPEYSTDHAQEFAQGSVDGARRDTWRRDR